MITVQQAHELYTDDDPGHDSDHTLRVLTLTERIGQAEGSDLDILRVADKLHAFMVHVFDRRAAGIASRC